MDELFDTGERRALKQRKNHIVRRKTIGNVALSGGCFFTLCLFVASAYGQGVPPPPSNTQQTSIPQPAAVSPSDKHMPEVLRDSLKNIVVVGSPIPADRDITGSYEQDTPGLIGGMDEGARKGTISKDIGSIPVNIPIPIISIPMQIFGGLSGATKRELQEFRDELTEELANAGGRSLVNEGLALDVYRSAQKLPDMNLSLFAPTTPIPADTDAVLYVSIGGVTIDVQGKEAILTASAGASLSRQSDGLVLYETFVQYQNRDTLSNWTENDNALWRVYANFARHYLGREIAADVFERININHELLPQKTENVALVKKNPWQGKSKSTVPTLAWELELLGGDSYGAWTSAISEADISYDLEMYDMQQLVYAEKNIPGTSYTLALDIEPCRTYRWSVRPSYRVGNDVKYGEWMRMEVEVDPDVKLPGGKGIFGRQLSESPAYIQDFAALEIECGRR